MLPASCPAVTGQGCAGPVLHLRPGLLLDPAQEATTLALPQPESCTLALVALRASRLPLDLSSSRKLAQFVFEDWREAAWTQPFLPLHSKAGWIPVQTFPPVSL